MKDGFIRVAAASPALRLADCAANAAAHSRVARQAAEDGVRLLVFPELSLTAATCGDLFFSRPLLDAAEAALAAYLAATADLPLLSVVGLPLRMGGRLYSCAAVCSRGTLLGIVPKTTLGRDDARYFAPAQAGSITFAGAVVPVDPDQLFRCDAMPDLTVAVEFGDDLGALVPPSCHHAAAGATVIAALAASPETVGAADYRRTMLAAQSSRLCCGYVYANAGSGESTTDLVFAGHSLIAERGTLLAERPAFAADDYVATELDVAMLESERMRLPNWPSSTGTHRIQPFALPLTETKLTRPINPHPFAPTDPTVRASRCAHILDIQAHGLAARIERAYAKTCVIGISGGLDSCLALLVTVRAMDLLGRSRENVIAVTMPCFGTTSRTRSNAELLCAELGVAFRTVDIKAAVDQHFADIGHDPANRNVVYENSQARERTQIIMDIANAENGLVVGTGDLSELALGWATYNGDHMSNYGVNAAIPKTLVRHIVAWYADDAAAHGRPALAACLRDIVDTPVSPELLPPSGEEIAQKTEDLVGPYELHDFYLFHLLRHGYRPAKLYRLAKLAFAGVYDDATLRHWLTVLHRRFFAQQFKRSCLPDGPKIGTVGLSPRGDWRMPSDMANAVWMAELEQLI